MSAGLLRAVWQNLFNRCFWAGAALATIAALAIYVSLPGDKKAAGEWATLVGAIATPIALIFTAVAAFAATRSVEVYNKQADYMKAQHDVAVYRIAVELLQDDKVRAAKDDVKNTFPKDGNSWNRDQQKQARLICIAYDVAAKLSDKSAWVRDALIEDWDIAKWWSAVNPEVHRTRENEENRFAFRDFEKLMIETCARQHEAKHRERTA